MKVTAIILLALWHFGCDEHAAEPELEIRTATGRVVRFPLAQLKQKSLPAKLTIDDPHEQRPITYEAFQLASLLGALGLAPGRASDLLFHCADGFEITVSSKTWRQHRYDAYLAFRIPGRRSFRVTNVRQDRKQVDLGPYYLIWDTRTDPTLRQLPGNDWPYQVTTIEITSTGKRLADIRPLPSAPPNAERGFEFFRHHCIGCHSINGHGGRVGPELNYPVNVTEYFDRVWLARWIRQPTSLRFNASMPPLTAFGVAEQDVDPVVSDVAAYLASMRSHKVPPRGVSAAPE